MDKIKAAREELLKKVEENTTGPRCWSDITSAVDAYTAALSTQSPKWVNGFPDEVGKRYFIKTGEFKIETVGMLMWKNQKKGIKGWYEVNRPDWNLYPIEDVICYLDESPSSTHPLQEKIDGLREAIQQNIDWMKKNRPSIAGLGAPIHLLQQALETYKL